MSSHRLVVSGVTLTAILFLTFVEPSRAYQNAQTPPSFIFGTWRIYRFEEVEGHASETAELAQKEIGRTVRFHKSSFAYDNNFLWFGEKPCSRVRYKFEIRQSKEYQVPEKGTLEFYGLEPAKKKQIRRVVVVCNGRPAYYFELSKGNQLSIYYDGWVFFLEKVK